LSEVKGAAAALPTLVDHKKLEPGSVMRIAVFRVLAATAVAWGLPILAAPGFPPVATVRAMSTTARSTSPRPVAQHTAAAGSATPAPHTVP